MNHHLPQKRLANHFGKQTSTSQAVGEAGIPPDHSIATHICTRDRDGDVQSRLSLEQPRSKPDSDGEREGEVGGRPVVGHSQPQLATTPVARKPQNSATQKHEVTEQSAPHGHIDVNVFKTHEQFR